MFYVFWVIYGPVSSRLPTSAPSSRRLTSSPPYAHLPLDPLPRRLGLADGGNVISPDGEMSSMVFLTSLPSLLRSCPPLRSSQVQLLLAPLKSGKFSDWEEHSSAVTTSALLKHGKAGEAGMLHHNNVTTVNAATTAVAPSTPPLPSPDCCHSVNCPILCDVRRNLLVTHLYLLLMITGLHCRLSDEIGRATFEQDMTSHHD